MQMLKTLFKESNRGVRFVSHDGRTFKLVFQPFIVTTRETHHRFICAYLMTCNGWVELATGDDLELPELDLLADHSQVKMEDLKEQACIVFNAMQDHIEIIYPHNDIDLVEVYNTAKTAK